MLCPPLSLYIILPSAQDTPLTWTSFLSKSVKGGSERLGNGNKFWQSSDSVSDSCFKAFTHNIQIIHALRTSFVGPWLRWLMWEFPGSFERLERLRVWSGDIMLVSDSENMGSAWTLRFTKHTQVSLMFSKADTPGANNVHSQQKTFSFSFCHR